MPRVRGKRSPKGRARGRKGRKSVKAIPKGGMVR